MKKKIDDKSLSLSPGKPLPLGATPGEGGVQFAVFSRNAHAVVLQLFDKSEDSVPSFEYALDPGKNKTGDIWHVFIKGIKLTALIML